MLTMRMALPTFTCKAALLIIAVIGSLDSVSAFSVNQPRSLLSRYSASALSSSSDDIDIVEASSSSSRRKFFSQMAGVASAAAPIAVANAEPSKISQLQSSFQDGIAPGHWIGGLLPLNSQAVNWKFPGKTPEEVSSALVSVLNALTDDRKARLYMPNFEITTATPQNVHVLTWTKKEWLDSLDVSLTQNGSTTVAKASFYATGFLPTSIPLAPILNIALFFIPFASPGPGEMLQTFRLRALEGILRKELSL